MNPPLNRLLPLRILAIAVFGIGLPLLSSCSNKPPGYEELAKLCRENAQHTVYKTVHVEGYYRDSPNCLICVDEDIIKRGFKYVELNIEDPMPYWPYSEPGIWRVERRPIDSGKCDDIIQKNLDKKRGSPTYQKFIDNYCLSVEKIDAPRSRYGYYYKRSPDTVLDNRHQTIIKESTTEIIDLVSGEVIAKSVKYRMLPYPNHGLFYGGTVYCTDLNEGENQYENFGIMRDTLKPIKGE